jgi:hypothetical protein
MEQSGLLYYKEEVRMIFEKAWEWHVNMLEERRQIVENTTNVDDRERLLREIKLHEKWLEIMKPEFEARKKQSKSGSVS